MVKIQMFQFHKQNSYQTSRFRAQMPVLLLLLVCFLAGTVVGCLIGSGAYTLSGTLSGYVAEGVSLHISDFLKNLFRAGQYHFLVLIAATSIAGTIAIPLISFFRGYFLSCAATALIAALPEHGVLTALISCGISAILTVPSLFLLELDGYALSMRLRAVSSGRSYYIDTENIPYDLAVSALCLTTAAVAECLLVPMLLSYLFR